VGSAVGVERNAVPFGCGTERRRSDTVGDLSAANSGTAPATMDTATKRPAATEYRLRRPISRFTIALPSVKNSQSRCTTYPMQGALPGKGKAFLVSTDMVQGFPSPPCLAPSRAWGNALPLLLADRTEHGCSYRFLRNGLSGFVLQHPGDMSRQMLLNLPVTRNRLRCFRPRVLSDTSRASLHAE